MSDTPLAVGDTVRLRGKGATGTIVRISPKLRAAFLVVFPVGPARAFRADELDKVTGSTASPLAPVTHP